MAKASTSPCDATKHANTIYHRAAHGTRGKGNDMTKTDTLTLTFAKERETKNTIRYQETVAAGDYPRIGTLYVSKAALVGIGNPDVLTVTIAKG